MEFLNDIDLDQELKTQLQQKIDEAMKAKVAEELESQTKGLKAKNDELLAEKKAIQRAREESDAKTRAEAEELAKKQNNFQQLYESQKEEADALRSKIEEMNKLAVRQTVQSQASKFAVSLTKDVNKAKLLEEKISQRLTILEGEVRVTDGNGQLTVSTIDDLVSSIKTEYPFLVDGIQATGGGATRAQGGAGAGIKEVSRVDFDAMKQGDRAKFIKDGGKVFDD
jgi:predicted RNase H-like nuclease (RuvC/YqgF family)